MTHRNLCRIAAIAVLTLSGACDSAESIDSEQRGGLLFELELDDVEQIHESYLPGEAIEGTLNRLTAPFDCSLYGDLCDVVGPEGAEELTGELVDMALDGAEEQDIEEHIDRRVDELSADYEPEFVLRSFGSAASSTSPSGTHRIRAWSGVFTPAVGLRRAWTRAVSEVRNSSGAWVPFSASILCVDLGANTQQHTIELGGALVVDEIIESLDPPSVCSFNATTIRRRTHHERNIGFSAPATVHLPPTDEDYIISSAGTATGTLSGWSGSVTSPGHSQTF